MTEPYNNDNDNDDDPPTLQRVPPTSSKIAAALPVLDAFPDEATTATDLDVFGSREGALPPAAIDFASDFDELETQKIPVEVRAELVRATQVDDGA